MEPITADTGTTDLGTQSTVITTKVGNKTTTTTSTSHDLAPEKKKRKREDGLPFIKTDDDVRAALKAHAANPSDALRNHIVRRARSMDRLHLVPQEWRSMKAEALDLPLILTELGEANRAEVILAEDGSKRQPDGSMHVRVPFYMGNSTANIKGFDKPLFFPASQAPIVAENATKAIAAGKQPLTVFARHAHRVDPSELPIGKVIGAEHRNGNGYAVLKISPKGKGEEIQALVDLEMVNAVSLAADDYEDQVEVSVNGRVMLETHLNGILGIDFAPNGPAMPTYGIQVLAEAVVEPIPITSEEEESQLDITTLKLEDLKAGRADLVEAIEKPHRDALTASTAEVTKLQERLVTAEAELTKAAIAAEFASLISRFPDPAKAKETLEAEVVDCKTVDAVRAKVYPILLDAYEAARKVTPTTKTKTDGEGDGSKTETKTAAQVLAEQLVGAAADTGTGRTLIEAEGASDDPVESAWGLPIPE